ncbi:MAG: hypothetical protein AVDCRST_MAG03-3271 [uncultured Rubrobacteraceae bacterium]|uniref:DUF5666 domain-containing protein n=1 Tax=uncultured Rubrobacteraceae bacterium TaxID=349277 RepID=A0A6J4Q8V2_9ACTN|nr:MAG: hypothetical protein AVDCRST_MAG03-3271 [uncultured Rubrobacteraceae bacterium]
MWIVAAVVAFGLAALLGGCARSPTADRSPEGGASGGSAERGHEEGNEATRPVYDGGPCGPVDAMGMITADYAFDPSDDRNLVGFADNVFLGRVLNVEDTVSTSDTSTPPEDPRSTFAVEVSENVKGSLKGTVRVAQDGGCVEYRADGDYPEQGIREGERVRALTLVDGDSLLERGEEYLLLTRLDERHRWHQIAMAPSGNIRIENEKHREALVRRFERAEKNQVDPTRRH